MRILMPAASRKEQGRKNQAKPAGKEINQKLTPPEEKPKVDTEDNLVAEKKEAQQAFEAETPTETVQPEKQIAQSGPEDSPVLSRRAEADKEKGGRSC